MADATKIALGVGCGILIAGLVGVGACVGCAALVSKGMHDAEVEQREALQSVVFENVTAERSRHGYVTIAGRLRNKGSLPVSSLKVGFKLKAKDGTVLDIAHDYPLLGSPLAPGEARSFSRTMRWPDGAETYEYAIEP